MPFKSSKARAAFFAQKKAKEKGLPALPEDPLKKLAKISKTELDQDTKELDELVKPMDNPLNKFKKLKNMLKPRF